MSSSCAGYRFDLDRLTWLSSSIRDRIADDEGWPVLDRAFRSTEPSIQFVGYAAERRFGPLSRFIAGTTFAAERAASAHVSARTELRARRFRTAVGTR